MKKLFVISIAVIMTASLFAQAPQKMSYQAVIRDNSNQLVVNKTVGMRISIIKDSSTGNTVYTETKTSSTNANGLVSIEIGGETGYNTIDWANGTYYIKTETDPAGGTNYTITGVSQILSVPYALNAQTANQLNGKRIAAVAKDEWVDLLPIEADMSKCWSIMARSHDFGYQEKYYEWRVIIGDNPNDDDNVYIKEVVNLGVNPNDSAALRVSDDGYIQGRWTGTLSGGPFCTFLIQQTNF